MLEKSWKRLVVTVLERKLEDVSRYCVREKLEEVSCYCIKEKVGRG